VWIDSLPGEVERGRRAVAVLGFHLSPVTGRFSWSVRIYNMKVPRNVRYDAFVLAFVEAVYVWSNRPVDGSTA
jgi:hypothetical protein